MNMFVIGSSCRFYKTVSGSVYFKMLKGESERQIECKSFAFVCVCALVCACARVWHVVFQV